MILRYTFTPPNNTRMANLCGPMESHIRTIETALEVTIAHRFEQFKIDGTKVRTTQALEVLQALYEIAQRPIAEETVQLMLAGDTALSLLPDGAAGLSTRRADLRARTTNQGSTSKTLRRTTSLSALAQRAPARPISRWRARSMRWSAARCSASC